MAKGRTPDQGRSTEDIKLALALYATALGYVKQGNLSEATRELTSAIQYDHKILDFAKKNNQFAKLIFYDICKSIHAEIDSTEVDLLLICFYEFEKSNNNALAYEVLKRVYSRPENFDRLDNLDSHNLLKTNLLKNYRNDIIQWRKQIHEKKSAETDPIVMEAIRDLHEKFVQVMNRVDTEATDQAAANRATAETAAKKAAKKAAAKQAATEEAQRQADQQAAAEAARNQAATEAAAAEAARNQAAAETAAARAELHAEKERIITKGVNLFNEIQGLFGYLTNDISVANTYDKGGITRALNASQARVTTLNHRAHLYYRECIKRVKDSPADNNDISQQRQQIAYALHACRTRLEELKSALLT